MSSGPAVASVYHKRAPVSRRIDLATGPNIGYACLYMANLMLVMDIIVGEMGALIWVTTHMVEQCR